MTAVSIYSGAGVLLFSLGLGGLFFCTHMLRRILAVNIAGSGVFLVLVALPQRGLASPADPIPHALVLTGIVVAVSATAVALALHRRLTTLENAEQAAESPHD